jgi:hypothetical protein
MNIGGRHQIFGTRWPDGPMMYRNSWQARSPERFRIRGRGDVRGMMNEEGIVRAYLQYILKHILLHLRVMYSHRTAADLDSIQHDIVVLSANPGVVARIERWQVLVHRRGKWMMRATPLSSTRQELLVLVMMRK